MGRTQTLSTCGCVQQIREPVDTSSKHIEKVGIQSEPWICYQPISKSRGREEKQVERMWGQPGRGHADPSVGKWDSVLGSYVPALEFTLPFYVGSAEFDDIRELLVGME